MPKVTKKKIKLKKQKTFSLVLTHAELIHLRDLFSVLLPSAFDTSISQALAKTNETEVYETMLFKKVHELCCSAELPVGDEAPDFVVTVASHPQIGVFPLNVGGIDETEINLHDIIESQDEE
jgi:hypothetical protein